MYATQRRDYPGVAGALTARFGTSEIFEAKSGSVSIPSYIVEMMVRDGLQNHPSTLIGLASWLSICYGSNVIYMPSRFDEWIYRNISIIPDQKFRVLTAVSDATIQVDFDVQLPGSFKIASIMTGDPTEFAQFLPAEALFLAARIIYHCFSVDPSSSSSARVRGFSARPELDVDVFKTLNQAVLLHQRIGHRMWSTFNQSNASLVRIFNDVPMWSDITSQNHEGTSVRFTANELLAALTLYAGQAEVDLVNTPSTEIDANTITFPSKSINGIINGVITRMWQREPIGEAISPAFTGLGAFEVIARATAIISSYEAYFGIASAYSAPRSVWTMKAEADIAPTYSDEDAALRTDISSIYNIVLKPIEDSEWFDVEYVKDSPVMDSVGSKPYYFLLRNDNKSMSTATVNVVKGGSQDVSDLRERLYDCWDRVRLYAFQLLGVDLSHSMELIMGNISEFDGIDNSEYTVRSLFTSDPLYSKVRLPGDAYDQLANISYAIIDTSAGASGAYDVGAPIDTTELPIVPIYQQIVISGNLALRRNLARAIELTAAGKYAFTQERSPVYSSIEFIADNSPAVMAIPSGWTEIENTTVHTGIRRASANNDGTLQLVQVVSYGL